MNNAVRFKQEKEIYSIEGQKTSMKLKTFLLSRTDVTVFSLGFIAQSVCTLCHFLLLLCKNSLFKKVYTCYIRETQL